MKALSLPISEKKNFEIFFLSSYVPNCDLRGEASFDPGAHHMNKLGKGPQGDAILSNIKALGLQVSKKKNFEIFFLCSYVPTCDPLNGASFGPRGIK